MLKTTFQRARPRQRLGGLVFVAALLLPACDLNGNAVPTVPPIQVVTAGPSAVTTSSAVTTPPPTLTAPPPQPTGTSAPPAAPTLPAATLVIAPPTTTAGNPLPVSEVTNYKNTLGAFTVIGTVRNQGTQPLTNIRVTATVSDNKGATIGTAQDTFLPLVVTIPPGASAPFSIVFEGFSGDPAKVDVASQADVADAANKYPPAGLTVSDTQLNTQVENGSGTLTGQVKNTGPAAASSVRVLAMAYN
ncbi:MAG: FxLYD domain-containing protein, partial [Chloroflexota bacterium]|nr:FxLYD domain-containing protein [Chloroflexota bacterium]